MNSNQSIRPILHIKRSGAAQTPQPTHPAERPVSKGAVPAALVLIRGLPGSGKTTMASVLTMIGYKHFEADMFFEANGVYRYDASRIREAHAWCQQMTRQALSGGHDVVVSNTFTHLRELEPYRAMASGKIQIIEAKGRWENVHGVAPEMLVRMEARWEQLPTTSHFMTI